MHHAGEGDARTVSRAHSILGEAHPFIAAQDGREIAPIAPGDNAVAFTQLGGDMGDLEPLRFTRVNRTAEHLESFHEEGTDKVRLKAASLGLFHLLLHIKQALGGKTFLGECVSTEDGHQVLAVERVVDCLIEACAYLGLVAVSNGFQ